MRFTFPDIGPREIAPSATPGHFLYLGVDGWCDCFPSQDEMIRETI